MARSLSETVRESLGPENVLSALSSEVRAERAIATEYLKSRWAESVYRERVLEYLRVESSPSPLLLDALSMIAEVGELPAFELLQNFLNSEQAAIRKNGARVLARCFSGRCHELRAWFEDAEIRHECCFSGDAATAEALWQWYCDEQRTPEIAFGILLTPELLCRLADQSPASATHTAAQFGYLERMDYLAAKPLLECGIWSVPDGISADDSVELGRRSAEIEAAVVALRLRGTAPHDVTLNLESMIDVAALIGAVRNLDHQTCIDYKFENRLHSQAVGNIRRALCKHAPVSFCRKLLISDVLLEAGRLRVRSSDRGAFVLEHAAAVVTHDVDLRTERLMFLKSRWAQPLDRPAVVPSQWTMPVLQDADAPELKYKIIPAPRWSQTRTHLSAPSPGALSAARLLQLAGSGSLIEPLFEFERTCEGTLLPCGCELQLMFSAQREHESLPWKQTLRALGIASPRRPEYRSMVEVSFPPSRSYLPQVMVPLLLERLGFFVEPADIALHQSYSGNLGEDVRYLLFAQQFINEPRVRPGAIRLARLMSKGFAHLNSDAVALDGVDHAGQRTELRSYRFGYSGSATPEPLQRHFIDDIIETSLLVAAKVSRSLELQQVWLRFCQDVTKLACEYPPIFMQLLESDWFACTGEPRDEDFAARLPICQLWRTVKAWNTEHDEEFKLRNRFRDVRTRYAKAVGQLLRLEIPEVPQRVAARCDAHYLDVNFGLWVSTTQPSGS